MGVLRNEFEWTEQHIVTLKRMIEAGDPYSAIGKAVGCSRSACIGKARRLGLASARPQGQHPRPARSSRSEPVQKSRAPRVKHTLINAERQRSVAAVLENAPLPDARDDFADNPTALVDLESHHCRWPLGDPREEGFHFCGGEKMAGMQYCGRHVRRSLP